MTDDTEAAQRLHIKNLEAEIQSLRRERDRLEAELNHKVSVAEDATTALVDLAADGEFTRLRRERDRLRTAPTDSGVVELDKLCEKYNAGEIDLCALVSRAWNTAIALKGETE